MLFAVPWMQALLAHFRAAPTRLGGLDQVAFVVGDSGQRLALVDGVEVHGGTVGSSASSTSSTSSTSTTSSASSTSSTKYYQQYQQYQ